MSQALILSAGFGTRLKPISNSIPKPLFPVLTVPILKRHILFLKRFGFEKVIINLHYLREIIEHEIKSWQIENLDIIILKEDEILGTGGGIRNSFDYINKNKPLLIHNSDILCFFDPNLLIKIHTQNKHTVTLLTNSQATPKKIKVDGNKVISFDNNDDDGLLYTGICVLSADFIKTIPAGKYYCLVEAFKNFLKNGNTINHINLSQINTNPVWFDIGTFKSYYKLHELLFRINNIDVISKTLIANNVSIKGWACIGKDVSIGKNVIIKNSIIFDGAIIKDNEIITDSIIHGDTWVKCL